MSAGPHVRPLVLRLVCALVMVLGVSALAAPGATAAAAVPVGLSASGSPVPTLSWASVSTATRYRVQGSEDSSFSSLLFDAETSSTAFTPTRMFRAGTLHWRVQAGDPTGTSAWATSQTTIAPPRVPTSVTVTGPVLPPVSPPVISWNPVQGATSYEVEMDAEGDGVGGFVRSTRTTTFVWPDPQGVGETGGFEDFFVRVRARFDHDLQSDWSTWKKYDVAELPPVTSASCDTGLVCAPHPSSGVRASRTVQDVVFDWDPVKGAKQYEIWVALDRDFNNQVEKRIVHSTRYSPESTYDNNNYFWKVRAHNVAEQPTPWPAIPNVFQRRWPMAPSLVYPPVASTPPVTDDFYYQWSPVKHATYYRLDVGTDPNFSSNYATCRTASTTYTPRLGDCMPSQGVLTYWRVRAYDSPRDVTGINSATGQFVYDSGRVAQLSPAHGATVTLPTLRWAPSTDADRYKVTVTPLGAGSPVTVETHALSWTPTDALPTESDDVDPGRQPDGFTWTVSARDADGRWSPTYSGRTFYLTEGPAAGGAQPLLPSAVTNPVPSRFPALSWQPWPSTVEAPVYYILRVSETPGYALPADTTPVLSVRLPYAGVTDTDTYFLRPRTYTWWVDAYNASTNQKLGTSPSVGTFTIEAPPTVTGQRIALDGKALDAGTACTKRLVAGSDEEASVCQGVTATPVLDWNSVTGAGGYLVYISEDRDFTNLLRNPVPTTNSRWTPAFNDPITALDDNESGPAYFWYVRPCQRIEPNILCGPGPESTLDSGTSAFRKVSPKVALLQPDANASFADEVTFTWEDYHDTNQAAPVPFGATTPSHQTGMQYRIQVAQSATITDANRIDERVVDQPTYTPFDNTYPEGDLWWRVQAIDAQGNRLAWSETRKLVKATPAPNLNPDVTAPVERVGVDPSARPAFNSRLTAGPVLFQWTAENFDATWDIEVYANDDTTLSNANRVFSERTRQAAYVFSEPLAPSSEPYRWRVRRIDVRDKPGRWSDLGRFWVDPMPVSLEVPADGATLDPSGTSFTWSPYAPGATAQAMRYVFDIEPVGGVGANPGAQSTPAGSWSPVDPLPTGSYTWSVRAYDARNNLLGSSVTRTFTVDGAVRVVTPTQISAPDGSAIGKSLVGVAPVWSRPEVRTTYQWLRDGNEIGGATAPTYTLTADDYTRAISLRVTGTKPGFTNGVSVSNALAATAGGALVSNGLPVISGKASVGEALAVTTGGWSLAPQDVRYQWLRQGAPIPQATGSIYRPTPEDAGRTLTVTVFARTRGFEEGSATAVPVTVARLGSTTSVALSATRVKPGTRVKIGITVSVPGVQGPTGQIKVFDGAKALKTLTLVSARNGQLAWKLPQLKKGKHKIKAVYLGNAATNGSKSSLTKLFVVR